MIEFEFSLHSDTFPLPMPSCYASYVNILQIDHLRVKLKNNLHILCKCQCMCSLCQSH